MHLGWTLGIPTLFAAVAYKKKSVDVSGAFAGWLTAFTCCLAGREFFASLLWFFTTSTLLTRFGSKRKKALEAGYKEGGYRNWVQVLCNGLTGSVLCVAVAKVSEFEGFVTRASLCAAFIGHYACCCGDTWASELGIAIPGSVSSPVLVTTMRPCARGTNGGMSAIGTAASALGGLGVGIVFFASSSSPPLSLWMCVGLGLGGGFGGSLLDSLLGATLQYSGWNENEKKVVNEPGPGVRHICGSNLLDNHAVNFAASFLTAQSAGFWAHWFFAK